MSHPRPFIGVIGASTMPQHIERWSYDEAPSVQLRYSNVSAEAVRDKATRRRAMCYEDI